jgi:serine/threonine protein kinase
LIAVLENGILTNASDIWSFAILLWELFTHYIPFGDLTPMECGLKVFFWFIVFAKD